MPRGMPRGGWPDGPPEKSKIKLEENKKFCKTEYCYRKIWKWEEYCDPCELSRYPERAKNCLVCFKKTLYNYCDKHDKKCLSCDSRDLAENNKYYCAQHSGICLAHSCSVRTGRLYCEFHQKQEDLKRLVQQKTSLSNPQEIIRFETWWNKNLAIVINGNSSYTLWVLVYEPAERSRSKILQKFEISNGYDKSSLSSAQNRASILRNELNGENPILVIHPSANSYVSFSEIVKSPYVTAIEVPCEYEDKITMVPFPNRSTCRHAVSSYVPVNIKEKIPNKNPENYLKPLDIVKVARSTLGNKYYHFGIYLGNGQVCHYSDPNSKKSTLGNRVRITDWETFVRECADGEVIGYHAIIPFKHYQGITKSIAWDEANRHGNGEYCLANNNCEHYINSRIFGLNYSKQVEERPSRTRENAHRQGVWDYGSKCYECSQGRINNGKSGAFCLRNELNQNLNQTNNNRSQEIERRYLQEVPVKDNSCRIM